MSTETPPENLDIVGVDVNPHARLDEISLELQRNLESSVTRRILPWHPVSDRLPSKMITDPSRVNDVRLLLLYDPEVSRYPVRGWFLGGVLNEWRIEGSNSEANPTHWMVMPPPPGVRADNEAPHTPVAEVPEPASEEPVIVGPTSPEPNPTPEPNPALDPGLETEP